MTSMVLGDGVLTPAQSVLGAVYGLQVKTSVSQGSLVTLGNILLLVMLPPLACSAVYGGLASCADKLF